MSVPQGRSAAPLPFDNSYARLPEPFYARVEPMPVAAPRLLRLNRALAAELGLDPDYLAGPEGVEVLAGNRAPPGAEPLAMAYAGHQFGHFVPSLGDGRAVLLGEVVDPDGRRWDLHLKGAGRTPFARGGDGRAPLGPVIREYIVSEAMAGLGIPTTRSLAAVISGETVLRDGGPEPGGVLARVAASHLRVGSFEYFARRGDTASTRRLADYAIQRHCPGLAQSEDPYGGLLAEVVGRQARLIARWMEVGFIHGVMNTDNMAISGETIDFGPCAFMDAHHPATVYSFIDRGGRYAYGQQPHIGHWNLARLAECLLPLLADDQDTALERAYAILDAYPKAFEAAFLAGLGRKLGLAEARDGDRELALDLLERMAEQGADHTLTFWRLADLDPAAPAGDEPVRALFADPAAFDAWAADWRARLASEGGDPAQRRARMRAVNPAFIPRNHRVEQAIQAVVEDGDTAPMEDLLAVVSRPFDNHPDLEHLARPPQPHETVRNTFCGT